MGFWDFLKRGKGTSHPKRHAAAARMPDQPVPDTPAAIGAEIARSCVQQLHALEGVVLDYSPESLRIAERILDRCSARGMRSATQEGLVLGLGCYLGEVFVRHARGTWVFEKDTPIALMTKDTQSRVLYVMVPRGEEQQFVNLFKKIAARLDGDAQAPVKVYYDMIVGGIDNFAKKKG